MFPKTHKKLNVNEVPQISSNHHEYFNTEVSQSISLQCRVSRGQPAPIITWYKGENDVISEDSDDVISGHIRIIGDGSVLNRHYFQPTKWYNESSRGRLIYGEMVSQSGHVIELEKMFEPIRWSKMYRWLLL